MLEMERYKKEIKCWKWKCFRKKSNAGNKNVLKRNQMLKMERFYKEIKCWKWKCFRKKSNVGNVCRVHLRWQIVPASCCPKDHSHALKVDAMEIHVFLVMEILRLVFKIFNTP